MKHAKAEELRSLLASRLKDEGYQTYPKVEAVSDGVYEVRLILHPDESELSQRWPQVKVSPWVPITGSGEQYVKRTPRTPSQMTDNFGFYPSAARRHHDGPASSPDVNPAYSGLRRIPEIQDIVRRVAMRRDLKNRVATVERVLGRLDSLRRFARAGHGYQNESEHLLLELLSQLKEDGHTGRHKIVRLTRKLQSALKADGYSFTKD